MPTSRHEDQLLICVARRSLDDAGAEHLRALVRREIDWEHLVQTARRHCLIPLLYHHLNSVCREAVPSQVMAQLRDENQENTQSSLFLTGELLKLMDLLEGNGIHAIPFKGPTLALSAYGELGFRQFSDLDILVHKQDVPAVRKLLVDRGFRPKFKLTAVQEAALLHYDYVYDFGREQPTRLWVEIHWGIVARYFCFDFDFTRVWDRLEVLTIAQRQLRTLSPEDLLMILCVHGSRHLWNRLAWISDIAGLIERRKDINWQRMLRDAAALGSQRMLSLGLFLAGKLLEAPIPQEVWQTVLADPGVPALAEHVERRLFAEENAAPGVFEMGLLHLRMKERKRDWVKSCVRLLATSTVYDWMFLPLPDWLFFLYYPLRPVRLAGKYGAKLLKGSEPREFD